MSVDVLHVWTTGNRQVDDRGLDQFTWGRGCSTRFRGEDALSSDTPRDESAVARRGQSRGRGRQQGQGAPQASPDPRKTGARMGNQERNAGKDTVSRHRSVKGWGQACDISGTDKLD